MRRVDAPFTPDQVESLNAYQVAGVFHEFTCGGDHDESAMLLATTDGWVCSTLCGYTQSWAHEWMADWSWKAFVGWENEGGSVL